MPGIETPTDLFAVPLPAEFTAQMRSLLGGSEAGELFRALDAPPAVSVRLNLRKCCAALRPAAGRDNVSLSDGMAADAMTAAAALVEARAVGWFPEAGRYLSGRPRFTLWPELHGGAVYVQEASSMFTGQVFRWLTESGVLPPEGPMVLDLCAAPGGKSTLLSSLIGEGGVLVANEVIRQRAHILSENVQKWGDGNTIVTSADPAAFASAGLLFDAVLVDAPCSGEGMFRKGTSSPPGLSPARTEWSPENVRLCAARARRIVSDVWPALRPGGALIFSTCTFNTAENEENVAWIARELGGTVVDLSEAATCCPEITVTEGGCRFYPHRTEGEGFFMAAIIKHDGYSPYDTGAAPEGSGGARSGNGTALLQSRKTRPAGGSGSPLQALSRTDEAEARRWLPGMERFVVGGGTVYAFSEPVYAAVSQLLGRLGVLYSGVAMGEMIRGTLKPAHALALHPAISRETLPAAELGLGDALEYLRRSPSLAAALFPNDGLHLVYYEGLPLGFAKRIGPRVNNLYPAGWRILMK